MSIRNRAEGWKYAKLSGHENEETVKSLMENDDNIQSRILRCAKKEDVKVVSIDVGGLKETNVDSVLGNKTKSKTDIHIILDDNSKVNISVKKSAGGQVFLIGADRFIRGFELQYNKVIPQDVKRAIALYWGTAADTKEIIEKFSGKNKSYEFRKHRLVRETLDNYDSSLSEALINWFSNNIEDVFSFCFSRGLAKNSAEWANIVWYKNELHENEMDDLINLDEAKANITNDVSFGTRTGGSTIQLPFGFVQWHCPSKIIPGDMQFHHGYDKVIKLTKKL